MHNPGSEASMPKADDFTTFYSTMGVDPERHDFKLSNYSASGLPKELVRNLILLGKVKKTNNKEVRSLNAAPLRLTLPMPRFSFSVLAWRSPRQQTLARTLP